MPGKTIKNSEASIRARLMNYAKKSGENYNAVLLRFFQERFLARLGASKHKSHFVLKGGFLLLTQHISKFRPTKDIDMLGKNIDSQPEHLKILIQEIAKIDLKDGVTFDVNHVNYETIKEGAEYEGMRYSFTARLGKIKSKLQIDVGFGDEVPGGFIDSPLPTLLPDSEFPSILHYPLESIIAEKFQAIVYLGYANSRMKDFYDIIFLAENNSFFLKKLKTALEATFSRRETDIEKRDFIYRADYVSGKRTNWKAFLRKINSPIKYDFAAAVQKINTFLEPVIQTENDSQIWKPDLWVWKDLE